MVAFFGVFLGGRLGNVLIYQRDEFFADPLMVFRVWEGGMASHGGILGVAIFSYFYARHKKISWLGLGDGVCVVAPLGIMFGRLANFINGELYGRIARGSEWAMKFPNTLFDPTLGDNEHKYQRVAVDMAAKADANFANYLQNSDQKHLVEHFNTALRDNDALRQQIGTLLEPRYPSQLFQAAGEGLCLFLILLFIRIKFPKLPHGVITGLFFILYAFFRISMENFRQQEIADVHLLGMTLTMGQFLSVFMIFIGAGFIAWAVKNKDNNKIQQ